jgi:hypothetical protein
MYNNFGVEIIGATGRDIGWQQSIREIPGLLAFTAVLWLMVVREQNLALIALFLQGFAIAATGYVPTLWGFYLTTLIMSFGFHYYETMNQSLALQWLDKRTAPVDLGRIVSVGAMAQLAAYGGVILAFSVLTISYQTAFLIAGLFTMGATIVLALLLPRYVEAVPQTKTLVMRRRYWLYYALTMLQGARRQVFVVFASFMLVSIFKFTVADIAFLFLINCCVNMVLAPRLGWLIARYGERWSLTGENVLLVVVFLGYALCASTGDTSLRWLAAILFCVDGISVTLGIAIKTYFQKIGAPEDMASQAGVAFSINHIMAVLIPVILGSVWMIAPPAVFIIGAAFACVSITLARLVPARPMPGGETVFSPQPSPAE